MAFDISEMGLLSPEGKDGKSMIDMSMHKDCTFNIKGEEIGHCRLES